MFADTTTVRSTSISTVAAARTYSGRAGRFARQRGARRRRLARRLLQPSDLLEHIWIRDIVDLVWEVNRLRRRTGRNAGEVTVRAEGNVRAVAIIANCQLGEVIESCHVEHPDPVTLSEVEVEDEIVAPAIG